MDVLIYGATGFTGTLVARALQARGIAFGVVGRSRERLADLVAALGGDVVARTAELHHVEALRDALADARVVVSCAGPFTRFGEPVVRAAMHAGAHYLDTTGEQRFMRDIYERYESATRQRGLCFVSGQAFEVALGDWAAELAARALAPAGERIDEIAIGYAIEGLYPTRGTRLSALEAAGDDGFVWQRGRWDRTPAATETRTFGFPPPFGDRTAVSFPSGEVITVPRHVQADRVQTFLALPRGAASLLAPPLGRFIGAAVRSPLGAWLRRRTDEIPPAPTAGQRGVNDFAVTATARRGFEQAQVCVSGTDVYGITADTIALGVERLLAPPPRAVGVCAPAEAFDARASLASLPVRVTASFPLS